MLGRPKPAGGGKADAISYLRSTVSMKPQISSWHMCWRFPELRAVRDEAKLEKASMHPSHTR
jgi:hypothetical protein